MRVGEVREAVTYAWSSAAAYVGRQSASAFLCMADVLAVFGRPRRRAQRAYAQFLREGSEGSAARSPWKAVVAQTLLGAQPWVEAMRERLAGTRRQLEVPATRQLPKRPGAGGDCAGGQSTLWRAAGGLVRAERACQPEHPLSAAFTAFTKQSTVTSPVPSQLNDGHWSSDSKPRAMFTPFTSSVTVTLPSSSQSPVHGGTAMVGVGVGEGVEVGGAGASYSYAPMEQLVAPTPGRT